MKHELECKIRLNRPMEDKLSELGAICHGRVHEKNWVFERNGELFAQKQLLRLRVTDNNPWGILTHKAMAPGENIYKRRIETEVQVESAHNLRLIFESLGYKIDWFYEKRRQSWEYKGCEIVLDTMPELGEFIEIEAENEEKITAILNELSLSWQDSTKDSYRQIWLEYCQQSGRSFCDWRFPC